ncbi:hypothetical protein D3C87_1358510 [compost metagenome]
MRLHWGSKSARRIFFPIVASIHPKLKAVVVLLTPPLWLKRQMILAMCTILVVGRKWILLSLHP